MRSKTSTCCGTNCGTFEGLLRFELIMRGNAAIRLIALSLVLAGVGLLTGCSDNFYADDLEYEVRTDPIFTNLQGTLKELAQPEPDPPGQLPIKGIRSIKDPRNPYYKGNGGRIEEPRLKEFKASTLDPRKANSDLTKEIGAALKTTFGSPRKPQVSAEAVKTGGAGLQASGDLNWMSFDPGSIDTAVAVLKLDYAHLKEGSRLYRLHCLQCHGITGNGRGPSAYWVNPHPRDYRSGIFKFQTIAPNPNTGAYRKPLRKDLHRTLYYGVEGTSMPAFNQLKDDELEALVSYVIHLSIRGETELKFFVDRTEANTETGEITVKKADEKTPVAMLIKQEAAKVLKSWSESNEVGQYKVPTDPLLDEPKDSKKFEDSIRRGQALFLGDPELLAKYYPPETYRERRPDSFGGVEIKDIDKRKYKEALTKLARNVSNCKECHIAYGKRAPYKIDEWGTLVAPADLTKGVYRGGRRPVDLYYRIHNGIKGSGMTNYGTELKSGEIWDLVHFLRALPYEQQRPNPRFTLRPK